MDLAPPPTTAKAPATAADAAIPLGLAAQSLLSAEEVHAVEDVGDPALLRASLCS